MPQENRITRLRYSLLLQREFVILRSEERKNLAFGGPVPVKSFFAPGSQAE